MRVDSPTFAGGEIADDLLARSDTAKYRTALRRARNVYLLVGGGAAIRPGMLFAGQVHDIERRTRVIPFQFSVDQGYAMELGHHTLRFLSQGGYVVRKEIEIVSISNGPTAIIITNGPHGYENGWDVVFENILGMTEINGLQGRVLHHDATSFAVDIDSSDFGIFTGSGGGVAGDAAGGTGGDPPPPAPPAETDPLPPPPPFYNFELPPVIFSPFNLPLGIP